MEAKEAAAVALVTKLLGPPAASARNAHAAFVNSIAECLNQITFNGNDLLHLEPIHLEQVFGWWRKH